MPLASQLFSNVKLLIQNKASPESILLYVQFKTNSYFGRCFTKTDSPIDSDEFIELMTHLDEELLKLEDIWNESYGNTNEIHKLAASFEKWNEFVTVNLAIICGLMLSPDAYVAYALNHMAIVHEAESERILSIETKQPQIHNEAKMKLRKECAPMVMVYPCLKRLEVLDRLNEDLKIALDQAEGSIDPNTVHQFIKILVDMNDSSSDESSEETSSEEIEEFTEALSSTISENEDPAKPCLGELTVEQLNSKKKYYGIRDEESTDSAKNLLPLMAMMGHMVDVEKSNAKYKEPTDSASTAADMILEMMEGVLKHEKPDETHQIMNNLLGAYKTMRDWALPGDEE